MSKTLNDEQQKYGEFYTNLRSISQAKQEGMDLESAKNIIKDYKKQINIGGLIDFWKHYEADTPEETEVLEICKEVKNIQTIKHNVKVCGGTAYLMTLGFSLLYSGSVPLKPRFVIQVSGTLLGCLYGIIISNKPNMAKFFNLGPQYNLGRIARDEITQWSSDEEISKQED